MVGDDPGGGDQLPRELVLGLRDAMLVRPGSVLEGLVENFNLAMVDGHQVGDGAALAD